MATRASGGQALPSAGSECTMEQAETVTQGSHASCTVTPNRPETTENPASPPKGATIPYRPKPASTPVIFAGGQCTQVFSLLTCTCPPRTLDAELSRPAAGPGVDAGHRERDPPGSIRRQKGPRRMPCGGWAQEDSGPGSGLLSRAAPPESSFPAPQAGHGHFTHLLFRQDGEVTATVGFAGAQHLNPAPVPWGQAYTIQGQYAIPHPDSGYSYAHGASGGGHRAAVSPAPALVGGDSLGPVGT
ncbi:hypothetical protein J1605_003648 [Eschrichtius robustus]|uniref:Uncharacterized protein n=1 Tax=Eschrichtius robustus TaxID=9764 RepID=A0AB34HS25_ESCRO|nr:hypothetical protein J1605_003648 [Eschrichtius robustus]